LNSGETSPLAQVTPLPFESGHQDQIQLPTSTTTTSVSTSQLDENRDEAPSPPITSRDESPSPPITSRDETPSLPITSRALQIETIGNDRPNLREEEEGNYIMLYCADIVNIECECGIKCGKYKVGYILSKINRPPAYHLSRLTQICPQQDLYWYSLCLENEDERRKIAIQWEKEVFWVFASSSSSLGSKIECSP
jgi:hypothetical protein